MMIELKSSLIFDGGCLRQLLPEDVHDGYVDGLNDPEINRYLDGVKRSKQTKQIVLEFVERNLRAPSEVLFGIWRKGDIQHSGTVRLHGIDNFHRTAHIGICLFNKATWGNRLGSKAIAAVTHWAFNALNLRWVEAGAYSENVGSQKAFLSAGYNWIYDIPDKYILDGVPALVKVYAARSNAEI